MNLFTRGRYLLLSAALVLATGCAKDLPTQPTPRTGTLHGAVWLHDTWGKRLTDHSGVTVSIEGTPYQAITQPGGEWAMPDLPAGTYTVKLAKDGFSEHRFFGYGFVGGGDAYMNEAFMALRPANFEFTSFELMPKEHGIRFSAFISRPEMENLPASIYIGTTPDVSSDPGNHLHEVGFSVAPSAPSNDPAEDEWVHLPYDELRALGVPPGTTLYCRAYLATSLYGGYYDPVKRATVWTNRSATTSDVIRFTLP